MDLPRLQHKDDSRTPFVTCLNRREGETVEEMWARLQSRVDREGRDATVNKVDLRYRRMTPLMEVAIRTVDLDVTRFLIANGANVAAVDDRGATCLHYMAEGTYNCGGLAAQQVAFIKMVCAADPSVVDVVSGQGRNYPGHCTALQQAVRKAMQSAKFRFTRPRSFENIQIIRALLECGADPHKRMFAAAGPASRVSPAAAQSLEAQGGPTCLEYALGVGCLARESALAELVRLFIAFGAAVTRPSPLSQLTANLHNNSGQWGDGVLHRALNFYRSPPGESEGERTGSVVQLFLNAGADVDATDDKGRTALFACCRGVYSALPTAIVGDGRRAMPTLPRASAAAVALGGPPSSFAVLEVPARCLLAAGANPNLVFEGRTFLDWVRVSSGNGYNHDMEALVKGYGGVTAAELRIPRPCAADKRLPTASGGRARKRHRTE